MSKGMQGSLLRRRSTVYFIPSGSSLLLLLCSSREDDDETSACFAFYSGIAKTEYESILSSLQTGGWTDEETAREETGRDSHSAAAALELSGI